MLAPEYQNWIESMMAKMQEKKFAYLIERKANNKNYFFYDIANFNPIVASDKEQIIWTPFQRNAAIFDTEEQVEEFQSQYITPRKSSIVRIVRPPAMIIMMHG